MSNANGEIPSSPPSSETTTTITEDMLLKQLSTTSLDESEYPHGHGGIDDADGVDDHHELVLGPLLPLKQQLEKDKEDESLRRWKEQLLGSIQMDDGDEDDDHPQVNLLSMSIVSPGRLDMDITLPFSSSTYKNHLFTLKEGSKYKLKFTFMVKHNIVSGLTYVHTVWKSGIKVDNTRVMLGTFAPQREPHVVIMEEETTPSGLLARGNYSAKTKFIDDDGRCHFEMEHSFSIRKDW